MEGKVHRMIGGGREMLGSQNRGPRPQSVKAEIIHGLARVGNLPEKAMGGQDNMCGLFSCNRCARTFY